MERTLLRILDAAANRAAEGLRVAEDVTRFLADDSSSTAELKRLRHTLAHALEAIPLAERLAARDGTGDVGIPPSLATPVGRRDAGELLTANLHRAQEALRSLEECSRMIDPALAPRIERLRHDVYAVEAAIAARAAATDRLAGRSLYILLTQSRCRLPVEEIIARTSGQGIGLFQVREKTLPDREMLAYLRAVRRWTRDADALLIVNDRPDLARLCDADGVHVGQTELSPREARAIVGPRRLVGVSTHSLDQARRAVAEGADSLGVGPVFPSATKTFTEYPGLNLVRQIAREITHPWYAIGGIAPRNIEQVREAGAGRVAVSDAVCGADDPAAAAAALRNALISPR